MQQWVLLSGKYDYNLIGSPRGLELDQYLGIDEPLTVCLGQKKIIKLRFDCFTQEQSYKPGER